MFYKSMWWLCRFLSLLLGGVRYIGRENIPAEGAFIVACNHRSNLDPFLVALGMKREMAFLAKDGLFKIPVIRTMLRWVNASPVNRAGSPKDVMDNTVEVLKKGRPTTIFPEGRRNKTEELLLEFKNGASLLAIQAGVPIVPVAVLNSRRTFGRKTVIYGPVIQPPAANDRQSRNELTAQLKETIRMLLQNN